MTAPRPNDKHWERVEIDDDDWDDLFRPATAHLEGAQAAQKSTSIAKAKSSSESKSLRHLDSRTLPTAHDSVTLNPVLRQQPATSGMGAQRHVPQRQASIMMQELLKPLRTSHLANSSAAEQQSQSITHEQLIQFARGIEELFTTCVSPLVDGNGHEIRRLPYRVQTSKREFSDNLWSRVAQISSVSAEAEEEKGSRSARVPARRQPKATAMKDIPQIHKSGSVVMANVAQEVPAHEVATTQGRGFCIRERCQPADDDYFLDGGATRLLYHRFLYQTLWPDGSIRLIMTSPPQEHPVRILLKGYRKNGLKIKIWVLGRSSKQRVEPTARDVVLYPNARNTRLIVEGAKRLEERKTYLRSMWISGNAGRPEKLGSREAHEDFNGKIPAFVFEEICRLPKPTGLSVIVLAPGQDGRLDRGNETTILRRFLMSRGLEVARGNSTLYMEKYIDVSTGETVSKEEGDVILPESDHTYRMLAHFIHTLTPDAVRGLVLEANDNTELGTKRGRSSSPQPQSSLKRPRV